jgi:hypothetical protein
MSYDEFMNLNSLMHRQLDKRHCLKVTRVTKDSSVMGGYLVRYDDYSIMSSDYAAISDVVNWVQWGERYVDNPGALYKCWE